MNQPEELFSKENFAKLSAEVNDEMKKYSWFQQHGYELVFLAVRLAFFAGGFFIFAQHGWIYKAIGMVMISYFFYGIGITGTHESRHDSFLKNHTWNLAWAYFFSDFWAGQSNIWWHHRHVVVHHVYTNVPSKEPKQFYFPWLNRYAYFFVVPYLVAFWLFFHSAKFLWGKWGKLTAFLVAQTAGWLFHIYLFTFFMPLHLAILSAFIMRSLFAPIFVHLAVFNHIGLEDPETRLPWLPHQTRTTRNLHPHWILTGMGGNAFVDCHIEHHLFPKVSNRMLTKIRPIVKKYLQKEGYKYVEETYGHCLNNCIKHYHSIFAEGPVAI